MRLWFANSWIALSLTNSARKGSNFWAHFLLIPITLFVECKGCVERREKQQRKLCKNHNNPPPLFSWSHSASLAIKGKHGLPAWETAGSCSEEREKERSSLKITHRSTRTLPSFGPPQPVCCPRARTQMLGVLLVSQPASADDVWLQSHHRSSPGCHDTKLRWRPTKWGIGLTWLITWISMILNLLRQRPPLASSCISSCTTKLAFLTALISSSDWNQSVLEKQTRWGNKINQLQKPF